MQSIEVVHGLHSIMASGPGHSRLHKKPSVPTKTQEINFVYLWSRLQCIVVSKYLCGYQSSGSAVVTLSSNEPG
jgi:hypothetical protein